MKRWHLPLAVAALIFMGISFPGCQKNAEEAITDTETAETSLAVEDDALADGTFGEVFEQVAGIDAEIGLGESEIFASLSNEGTNEAGIQPGGNPPGTEPPANRCFTITIVPKDPVLWPKTVTIDFGETGCKGRDGKVRKGKIITVYSKPMHIPGAQAVTEFNKHFIDDVQVMGRHVVKNNSTSAVRIMTRLVQNGKMLYPNGDYILWNGEHTNTQVAGLGTPLYPRDDEWNITGGGRGETSRGDKVNTWSRQIVEPLHKAFVCRWIDKGVVKLTRNGKVAMLNYGDGTCDDKAVMIIDGVRKEITLR